jgi:hypothetical protein
MSTAPSASPLPEQLPVPTPEPTTIEKSAAQKQIDSLLPEAKDLLASQLRPDLLKEIRSEYTSMYAIEFSQAKANLENMYAQKFDKEFAEFKKSITPLTPEELTKLVSQEYLEYEVPVREKKSDKYEIRTFTLRELSQESEQRFLEVFKKKLVPIVREFQSADLAETEADIADKIKLVLEVVEPGFNVLSELVLVCLDPFQEDTNLTVPWVKKNLSSSRMWNIVRAQFEVNRTRDFISSVSQQVQGMIGGR